MAEVERVRSLDVGQDLRFQRREWALQRVAWVLIAVAIVAALLGLTGRGPLSQATAGAEGDALRVAYGRFERLQSPTTLRVLLGAEATGGEQVEIWVEQAYLDGVEIQSIDPEPLEVRTGAERMVYVVGVDEPGQPLSVTFHLQQQALWRRSGRIGLTDGTSLSFGQFVYP